MIEDKIQLLFAGLLAALVIRGIAIDVGIKLINYWYKKKKIET